MHVKLLALCLGRSIHYINVNIIIIITIAKNGMG